MSTDNGPHPVPTTPLDMVLDTTPCIALPRRFSSGSVGWYYGGKQYLDGVRVQVSCSIVVLGSKPPSTEAVKTVHQHAQKPPRRPRKASKPAEPAQEPVAVESASGAKPEASGTEDVQLFTTCDGSPVVEVVPEPSAAGDIRTAER
jgi:hypothetical protein